MTIQVKATEQYLYAILFAMLNKGISLVLMNIRFTLILWAVSGLGYMKDYPYERVMRDSRILLIFEVSNY